MTASRSPGSGNHRPGLGASAPTALAILGAVGLLAGVARAEPLTAGSADCGGDAYSSAQVVEKRPPRRGPLTAMPQTLCADLAPSQPPASVEIGVYPSIGRDRGENGRHAPY